MTASNSLKLSFILFIIACSACVAEPYYAPAGYNGYGYGQEAYGYAPYGGYPWDFGEGYDIANGYGRGWYGGGGRGHGGFDRGGQARASGFSHGGGGGGRR